MTTVLPSRTKALPSMDQSIGNALAQTRFTLNEVQQGLSRLECLTEKPTRETFLIPLDDLCRQLQNKSGACDTFQCLHPDPDMRASVEDLKGEVDTMIVTIQQSSRLAAIMRTVDLSQLDRLDKRFVDHWTRDFLRAGAFLSPDDREQVKQMIAREGVLSRQWNRNVIEGQKSMIVSSDRLRSMSDEFLASHVPDEHGQVKLTTKYSDRMQILEYCEDETVRRDMAYLQNTVGYPANEPVLKDLLEIRRRIASKLGYKSWTHFSLETEMVDSPDRAMALIEELYQGTKDIVTKRISNLKEALDSDQPLQKWDMEYAKRLVIGKQTAGFSPLDARQYFRVQKVIPGLLQFAEEFYGVKLQARPDVKTWHDNVIVYDVYNNNEGCTSLMGRIYLDCLFHEDKENHPCTLGLTTGVEGKQYPEGVLVVGLEGGPEATMHFWDATACWHELGHLFHHILGAKHQRYHRFSGFEGIQYDFIEAPSQLAEEWLVNSEIVQRFAVNKRGETISEAMLQNLIQSERIVNPLVTCQRLLWARIALMYHAEALPDKSLDSIWKDTEAAYGCFPAFPADVLYRPEMGWTHLADYGPRYIAYQNSLAVSKELKTVWDSASGPLDKDVTRRYRETILERGSSVDASEMIQEFLGRPHTTAGYLKWLNAE